ncbi:RsmD family RNA methyltransferase [Chitinophaga nivalis]|uniref:RsmD family RNA methyltransferase n=1 Tax=Chitinophaga nivalis TaxID=2991709 RepID=A0ABT3IPV3_9BACT|nr:RsmD family RNA methyltransferase [Chitinophaga nivalis]MCW3464313.1 RsmD family RNA methyltransferase [Chitinophaga nivalis]MCW3485996.1 RsmD family RNA methyltransferase [Chitinophaga nivalis]
MRIIGGASGGRKIQPPAKMPNTRPTTDIAKGGLFNIIENNLDISSLKTLDIFGGTGSISYELASRGATDMTVVEKDPAMAAFIIKTAQALQIDTLKTVKMDVFKYLQQCTEKFDLIFADPPYMMETLDQLPLIIFERELLQPEGWLVVEHTQHGKFSEYDYYRTERNYGSTVFSVFINRPELKR